ncbi:ABC transporter ATP-binding protein [Granulicatella seriolae]|uniref:ABC transporter ATP-binding protein/permease n=1 Tax=Granulicatella seriolae TaxID=2967226 RepID=A0ABT1WP84_9LACT|nr:ABC transporter ATP-binding protein [Granulicatella seriolae]
MKLIIEELGFFFKQHKFRYVLAFISMIISTIALVLPARFVGQVIDEIVRQTLTWETLYRYIVYFLLAIITAYIFEFIWTYFIFVGSYQVQSTFRERMMQHLLSRKAPFYSRFRTGDLVTRGSEDIRVLGMTTGFGMYAFLNSSLILIVVLTMMSVFVSWKLMLVAMIPSPILAYLLYKLGTSVDAKFNKSQEAVSEMNNDVLEVIDGTYVVRAFGQEEAMINNFKKSTSEALEMNLEVAKIDTIFWPLGGIFMAVSLALGLMLGGYLVQSGEVSVGGVVSFQVYIGLIVWPVMTIGEVVNVAQQGNASIKRLREVFTASDSIEEGGQTKLDEIENIRLKNFSFWYPNEETPILKDLDLQIKKGETIGIVGKTGAGKTTLVQQLLHQYPYKGQDITINGQSILDFDAQELQSKIAYVPQEHILFSRSIRENMFFGKEDASDEEIYRALHLASFEADVKSMPKQLDTLVGEKGISLSGGQKQRLSIARAFIRDSEVLILDDALSAVDAKTEQTIISHIQEERKGRTNLITSHRLSAIRNADWIFVLDQGQVLDQGTHQDLLAKQGWYYQQYKRQEMEGTEDA